MIKNYDRPTYPETLGIDTLNACPDVLGSLYMIATRLYPEKHAGMRIVRNYLSFLYRDDPTERTALAYVGRRDRDGVPVSRIDIVRAHHAEAEHTDPYNAQVAAHKLERAGQGERPDVYELVASYVSIAPGAEPHELFEGDEVLSAYNSERMTLTERTQVIAARTHPDIRAVYPVLGSKLIALESLCGPSC